MTKRTQRQGLFGVKLPAPVAGSVSVVVAPRIDALQACGNSPTATVQRRPGGCLLGRTARAVLNLPSGLADRRGKGGPGQTIHSGGLAS